MLDWSFIFIISSFCWEWGWARVFVGYVVSFECYFIVVEIFEVVGWNLYVGEK